MSTTITIEKNLVCEQDMLLGREAKQQQRAGTTVIANPLRLLAVVDSINQLKTLDIDKYDLAFIRQDFPVVEEGQPVPDLPPEANEFYALDYISTADEDIPLIVQPNATVVGRWKRIVVSEASVKGLIIEEVKKATADIEDKVDDKVKKALEVQVPQEITNALQAIAVKGFEFDEKLKYKQNDYVKAFVRSRGVVTERLYMVDKDTALPDNEVDYAPLQGDTYRNINGTLIYEDNRNLQEKAGYVRVYTVDGLKKTFSVNQGSNYKLYEPAGAVYPRGILRVRALKAGKVSGYFEITFGGMSHTDFSFRNVMYSKSVRLAAATTSLGYIFYPGFAVYCDDTYFGLSVSSNTYVDSFELDYTDVDLVPSETAASYVTNKCYALREGGGSYIPNLGMTYYNMRKPEASRSGDTTEFYNFMSGTVPWTQGIMVDENLYHQYVAACVLPVMSNAGKISKNVMPGKNVGDFQEATLPNIRGGWDGEYYGSNSGSTGYGWRIETSNPNGWKQQYWGAFKKGRQRLIYDLYTNSTSLESYGWQFDASASSSVYKDGADVNQKALYKQERLQLF